VVAPSQWHRVLDRGTPLLGWARNLLAFCRAHELVGFDRFLRVQAWFDRGPSPAAWVASEAGLEMVCLRVNCSGEGRSTNGDLLKQ